MRQSPESVEPSIIGPNGDVLTLSHLPEANSGRWVMSRKAKVIAAIRGGLISMDEAVQRYRLTHDELSGWQAYFDRHGPRGLRTTFVQQYRFLRGA